MMKDFVQKYVKLSVKTCIFKIECCKFTKILTCRKNMKDKIPGLNKKFIGAAPQDVLSWFAEHFTGKIVFSTSLGAEDQVLVHMISGIKPAIGLFTLDTGRLFQETYELLDITQKKYAVNIDIYFPDTQKVEEMVRAKGINLFYESMQNRQLCCHVRKIEPLTRALNGTEVWITGMRKDQSVTRAQSSMIEWDPVYKLIKINPLIHWTDEMVWKYISDWNIPVNELHSKGYPSIGCLPCTRAVNPGEDIRSGRWWWELPENKECGLHKKH
jgi:phosphoadenosine phosphosulfate reductase